MKKLVIIFMLLSGATMAQEKLTQTRQFAINGEVEKASVITLDSLKQYQEVVIGDVKVTDHTGAFKHQDQELKGVLLKEFCRIPNLKPQAQSF